MNGTIRTVLFWGFLFAVIVVLFSSLGDADDQYEQVPYSQMMAEAESGRYASIVVEDRKMYATANDGRRYLAHLPGDVFMLSDLRKTGVEIVAKPVKERSLLTSILISWTPMLLLIGLWVFYMRQMQGGGKGGAFSFGKSRARVIDENANPITFQDVAGCEEAKEEVAEVVDFLKNPGKFQQLGGKIPRGVLLVGSPGTGKTMLARAIAGESQVPFFSISGSDFVEMFVGVGAARVRDMFEQAAKKAPCIVFIDEIDAVGRQRGAGLGGGNDEREQTLNQMLVSMDGFEDNLGVIVIAATNRPDVLDPALMRPGRFDRQVVVPLPDIKGRTEILKVHMRKVAHSDRVNTKDIARGTPGFSGADLANLVNEAALLAARANRKQIGPEDFERAKEKIIMGSERKSVVMPERERRNTAYHESGHAIVAKLLKHTDPVHKVTIIPRGRALGVTMQLPVEDRYNMNRDQIIDMICMLLAGRVAEELFMDQMTTGASNDFERATDMARRMVSQWGMSSKLGPMVSGESDGEIFIGRSLVQHRQVSEETLRQIDAEIRAIIGEQYAKARGLLEEHRDKVELMTKCLLEWETIGEDQINDIMADRQPQPPDHDTHDDTGAKGDSSSGTASPVVPDEETPAQA